MKLAVSKAPRQRSVGGGLFCFWSSLLL